MSGISRERFVCATEFRRKGQLNVTEDFLAFGDLLPIGQLHAEVLCPEEAAILQETKTSLEGLPCSVHFTAFFELELGTGNPSLRVSRVELQEAREQLGSM